jgi:hypothetical protein
MNKGRTTVSKGTVNKMMETQPAFFEEHQIRRVYDESTETWWFFGGGHRANSLPFKGRAGVGMG